VTEIKSEGMQKIIIIENELKKHSQNKGQMNNTVKNIHIAITYLNGKSWRENPPMKLQ
jgi:hypothetical protein